MKKKEIIISILFTILISLLMYFLSSKKYEDLIPVDVYEVFVEGKSIGYLSNEEEFLKRPGVIEVMQDFSFAKEL